MTYARLGVGLLLGLSLLGIGACAWAEDSYWQGLRDEILTLFVTVMLLLALVGLIALSDWVLGV